MIYQGTSNYDVNIKYISETKFIAEIRWNQHDNPSHGWSSANYLKKQLNGCKASKDTNRRKIHEALYISKFKLLNQQVGHKHLVLFKNGTT